MEGVILLFTSLFFIFIALRLGYEEGVSDGYERALKEEEYASQHIRY